MLDEKYIFNKSSTGETSHTECCDTASMSQSSTDDNLIEVKSQDFKLVYNLVENFSYLEIKINRLATLSDIASAVSDFKSQTKQFLTIVFLKLYEERK